ncbi:MAG TPA: isoleucine--tRNA ligase [Hyphomicrobiaceae bacterium]|nr:isoleucine--tRNA ligase [Hyphomicrobiaceae bacterium]
MTSNKPAAPAARDWSETLFLPKTAFPMKAGLPELEPRLLKRWAGLGMYRRLREAAKGRPKFILHDGPPYANGNIHIGTALNKILKDMVTRGQQMLGYDSNYVPGWDCHGLPIEWQIEQAYRAKGKRKEDVPVLELIAECRAFAQRWIDIQREEFKRLGVEGDWAHPYTTMAPAAEAQIAREMMKFVATGQLYRGSKPVMWSVVEKTALAEAEIEYQEFTSDTVWVKFPVQSPKAAMLPEGAAVVIWTTTPWTLPGNRAISFSSRIAYGLFEVTKAPEGNWAKPGDKLILAHKLAEPVMKAAKVEAFEPKGIVRPDVLAKIACAHPLKGVGGGYQFAVPLLDGAHVTDEDGTGFVHTAPGHGREDFEIWMASTAALTARDIDTAIPFTVDADGRFTKEAPGFEGKRVITEKGDKGDANDAVIKALIEAGALIARGRLKHQYPHSWRSKKPVIFRNTPQWFIAMDRPIHVGQDGSRSVPSPLVGEGQGGGESPTSKGVVPPTPSPSPQGEGESVQHSHDSIGGLTLRQLALRAIAETQWVPPQGQNRITGMIEAKPDWVLSRQRAWGVPIPIFVKDSPDGSYEILKDEEVNRRIVSAIEEKGISAWHEPGAAERFLGNAYSTKEWKKVEDICDVWFDSASTHAFTLEDPEHFPQLAGIRRKRDGGDDTVMYLEGSDQHRGWFHSSLLESCGTRGRAPYDVVLTHGFVLDEKGEEKMAKSKGNVVPPQEVIAKSGADILRLWVASADTTNDIRFGPGIVQSSIEAYRKIRNTLRWMLGTLAHYEGRQQLAPAALPELEQLMLHRLAEIDETIRKAYADYDYKRVVASLSHFMNTDLSAFYFDIRKDALYCEPYSSPKRRAALDTIEQLFRHVTLWLAPLLCFTAEEAWLARYPSEDGSVHLEVFPEVSKSWRNDALAEEWESIKRVRRVVTGALEIERANKRIGSALEASPQVFIDNPQLLSALEGIDFAEICITSGIEIVEGEAREGAFTLPDVPGVGVVPRKATGNRCARSWRYTDDVGSDPDFPDLSARDAAAVRELDARTAAPR